MINIDNELITFALLTLILSISIYFVDDSKINLSYSGEKMFKGEFWRLFTFSFVHLNLSHLIGNVIALTITTMLSLEIGLKSEYFLILFLSSSWIIAFIQGVFWPTLIIAGASLGIYSILGGISISGKNLIPVYIFVPLIVLSIFLTNVFTTKYDFIESFFHFFGFLFGITAYKFIKKYTSRKNYLGVIE